jgi:hypothetical protein
MGIVERASDRNVVIPGAAGLGCLIASCFFFVAIQDRPMGVLAAVGSTTLLTRAFAIVSPERSRLRSILVALSVAAWLSGAFILVFWVIL